VTVTVVAAVFAPPQPAATTATATQAPNVRFTRATVRLVVDVRVVATFEHGNALFAAVCERGLEGVVAKRERDPCRPGRVRGRASDSGLAQPMRDIGRGRTGAVTSVVGARRSSRRRRR
jgi:hypothetical protein